MGIKKDYRDFLNHNFRGLNLDPGLFYLWKNGLRFSMSEKCPWDESSLNELYFDEVKVRSSELFSAAFEPDEEMYVVIAMVAWKRKKIKFGSFVFRCISGITRGAVRFSKQKIRDKAPLELLTKRTAVIRINAGQLDYPSILEAISNSDFPSRKPSLQKWVYFINIERKLIFHMYDDRGLDIIATDKKTLLPMFHKYNDWILDFDRPMIVSNLADLKNITS